MEDFFRNIEENFKVIETDSEEFIYNDMESQSGKYLPVLYRPFDAGRKSDWHDRGMILDFLLSTDSINKVVLDFGPGDGWPCLLMAPYVKKVIGIEGSEKRRGVCAENAFKLGIENAEFIFNQPGTRLPLKDNSFDAVTAACSIEQTADPEFVLRELFRVLKPDGRLRMYYEDLNRYKGCGRFGYWVQGLDSGVETGVIFYKRLIEEERVVQYNFVFRDKPENIIKQLNLPGRSGDLLSNEIDIKSIKSIDSKPVSVKKCITNHPTGFTWVKLLKKAGFSKVLATHSGGDFARELFDELPEYVKPKDLENLDKFLTPLIKLVVNKPAPLQIDPMLTAIK